MYGDAAVHHGNCQLFVNLHDNTMMTRKLMTDEFPGGEQMDRVRACVKQRSPARAPDDFRYDIFFNNIFFFSTPVRDDASTGRFKQYARIVIILSLSFFLFFFSYIFMRCFDPAVPVRFCCCTAAERRRKQQVFRKSRVTPPASRRPASPSPAEPYIARNKCVAAHTLGTINNGRNYPATAGAVSSARFAY